MNTDHLDQFEQLRQTGQQRGGEDAAQPRRKQTIHYTELPEDTSGGRGALEWNAYRREVGRLLAEGNEGRWLLVKGDEIVGIWDTEQEADRVRVQKFLMQDVLIHQILAREPILRGPTFYQPCRS